jgi:putative iron-only hydrogenase system regulator
MGADSVRFLEVKDMETRVAVIGIIVENYESAQKLNEILHNYGQYIIGRIGIPYREKNISIISVAVDAPQDVISALSGKIGKLSGVSAKTAYSGVISK